MTAAVAAPQPKKPNAATAGPTFRATPLKELGLGPTECGALHLASLQTVADVLGLGTTRAGVEEALARRNLAPLHIANVLDAIDDGWQLKVQPLVGCDVWAAQVLHSLHAPAKNGQATPQPPASGRLYPFLGARLDELPELHGRKEVLAKLKNVGLKTIRDLMNVAATPDMDFTDDSRVKCFRWLSNAGFGVAGDFANPSDAVLVLNAIAARANKTPAKVSLTKAGAKALAAKATPPAPAPNPQSLTPNPSPLTPLPPPAPFELHIPLDRILPSPYQPRKTFDPAKLEELAATIRTHGLLQAIVVRPRYKFTTGKPLAPETFHKAPQNFPTMTFELIAGERRLRAAKIAGLERIRATVLAASDKEAYDLVMIENDQRDDVPVLEKADGYALGCDQFGYTAESLGKTIGRSRATVYGLILLAKRLPPAARAAVNDGSLPPTTAQLIARIPSEKLRIRAAKEVLAGGQEINARGHGYRRIPPGPMTFRDAKAWIESTYMLELKAAPFSRTALTLVSGAGACTVCPKMTGNNREEFPAPTRGDICTDPECYRHKAEAHVQGLLAAHLAAGRKILTGTAAAKIRRWPDSEKYLDLAAQCWEAKGKSYQKLLGPAIAAGELPVIVSSDAAGGIIEHVPRDKARGILVRDKLLPKPARPKSGHSAGLAKERARDRIRLAAGREAIAQIVAAMEELGGKWTHGSGSAADRDHQMLQACARGAFHEIWHDTRKAVLKRRGVELKKEAKFSRHDDMTKAFAEYVGRLSCAQALGLWAELVVTKQFIGSGYGPTELRRDVLGAFDLDWKQLETAAKKSLPVRAANKGRSIRQEVEGDDAPEEE